VLDRLDTMIDDALSEWHLAERKITPFQLYILLIELERKLVAGHVKPGDAVGMIAAQAIAAPQTQKKLNSFHTSGMQRLDSKSSDPITQTNHMLNCRKKLAIATMRLRLMPGWATESNARFVAYQLMYVLEIFVLVFDVNVVMLQ
jgi:hypothetical protein